MSKKDKKTENVGAPSGFNKVDTGGFMNFNKPGDYIQGTLVSREKIKSEYGGMTHKFRVKADEGEFHDKDENGKIEDETTKLEAGQEYTFFAKSTYEEELAKYAKLGQKVWLKFIEERKGDKFTYKFIPARLGKMDKEWMDDNGVTEDTPF